MEGYFEIEKQGSTYLHLIGQVSDSDTGTPYSESWMVYSDDAYGPGSRKPGRVLVSEGRRPENSPKELFYADGEHGTKQSADQVRKFIQLLARAIKKKEITFIVKHNSHFNIPIEVQRRISEEAKQSILMSIKAGIEGIPGQNTRGPTIDDLHIAAMSIPEYLGEIGPIDDATMSFSITMLDIIDYWVSIQEGVAQAIDGQDRSQTWKFPTLDRFNDFIETIIDSAKATDGDYINPDVATL